MTAQAGGAAGAGLDTTQGQHTDKKCDYAAYVSGKFYEYVAIVEMVYYLATEKKAREQFMQELSSSAIGHAGSSVLNTQIGVYNQKAAALERILSHFGLGDEKRAADFNVHANEYFKIASEEAAIAQDQFISACKELYDEIVKRFDECGWFYGIATLTTDGLFMVGEALLGAGISAAAVKALKAVKFAVSHLKDGKTLVKAIHPKAGQIERTFENKALKDKYGDPKEHHSGTETKDANRKPNDGKDGKDGDNKKSNKEIGNLAEAQAKKDLIRDGYTETLTLENGSGNGIDLVGRNPQTGELKVLEVKGNSAGLNELQKMGGNDYLEHQLELATKGKGSWAQTKDAAKTLQAWLDDAPAKKFEIWKYDVDPVTGKVGTRRTGEWDWQGKENRPKRIRFRKSPSPEGATDNIRPPPTGPPGTGLAQ